MHPSPDRTHDRTRRTPRAARTLLLTLLLGLLPLPALAQPTTAPTDPAEAARRERAKARIERAKTADGVPAEPEINPLGDLPEIDPARVQRFDELTNTLASPEMAGRFPGTPGIEMAATLIETEFTDLGLTPLFTSTTTAANGTEVLTPHSTFRQPLERGEELTISTGQLAVTTNDDGPGFAPARGSTHAVVSYSGTGSVTGPLIFCGYAVTAGPGDYLNFPVNADLEGKIAVVLTNEPMNERGESLWSNSGWSLNASVPAKLSAVTRRGAKAVLVVRPPALENDSLQPDEKPIETLRYDDVPILMLSQPMARSLLRRADPEGRTLDQLVALANAGPTLLDLDAVTVTVTTEVTRTPNVTDNLGALLPGVGPLAGEYVVVGAHYDHVGSGSIGSQTPGLIHPGADDNASGTADMLLVARTLAEHYAQLDQGEGQTDSARSIVFLAFTAEESGLEGSRLFVTKPPIPLDDVKLMLNLDMVGRMRDGLLELGGLQSAAELEDFVNPRLEESGLRIRRGSSVGDNRSDHANFDAKKVPNLFFFTGLHDEYHTPDDTPDLLNDEGAVRVADLVAAIALDAATTDTTLTHARARRAIGAPVMPKVRVGIVPGPHPDGGLSVRQVSPDTSASAAGLQPYDRITKWNGKPLNTLDEFSVILTEQRPGDTVTLTIIRDDEEIEVEMTLNAPR